MLCGRCFLITTSSNITSNLVKMEGAAAFLPHTPFNFLHPHEWPDHMFRFVLIFSCFSCIYSLCTLLYDPERTERATSKVKSEFGLVFLDWCVTFCMCQGSWESGNDTPLCPLKHHPRLHHTHPGWPPPPSPSPSSSDTSSWQPAPFNSLQHLLGLANHWCSAPSMATTPAPLLVGQSHLGPCDGEFLMCVCVCVGGGGGGGGGGYFTFQKQLKALQTREEKIKTSVIGIKFCQSWDSCCVRTQTLSP